MREGSVGGTPLGRDVSGAIPGTKAAAWPEGAPGQAGGTASGQDLLAFRRLYEASGEGEPGGREEGGNREGGEGNPARPEMPVRPEAAPFMPPWAGPLWAGPGSPDPAAAGGQGPAPADVSLPELATELIGRLLVKEGDGPAAGQEIRILLKHCALEGTEVTFRRGEEGLHLVFRPDSPAGGDLLRRKSDSLESLLRTRLSAESVKVSVLDPGDAGRPAAGTRG